ncbi:MAG: ribosome assembly cofactor RimP [Desulfovibrionaceae bacterium]|nr:ribosome assembly cofactor RimP [Desulfovibrionaceae bacterium]
MSESLAARLTSLAEPLAESLGLKVWGVEIIGQGVPVVRFFVDAHPDISLEADEDPAEDSIIMQGTESQGGVSIGQCEKLSRMLGLALEVEDLFSSRWTLEVSSPGLERTFFRLDQLASYIGRELDITLFQAPDAWYGRRHFTGILEKLDGESLILRIAEENRLAEQPETVSLAWENVRRARLVHHFPEPGKKNGSQQKKGRKANTLKEKPAEVEHESGIEENH